MTAPTLSTRPLGCAAQAIVMKARPLGVEGRGPGRVVLGERDAFGYRQLQRLGVGHRLPKNRLVNSHALRHNAASQAITLATQAGMPSDSSLACASAFDCPETMTAL